MAAKWAKKTAETRLLASWAVAAALAATMPGSGAAERQPAPRPSMSTEIQEPLGLRHSVEPANVRPVTERVARLRRTRDLLQDQAVAPLPPELPAEERAEVRRYRAWLQKSVDRLDELVRRGEALIRAESKVSSMAAMGRMQEMNRSFSLQYLALQNKLQQESREFYLISNVMKTRHDTAKNAINNLR